MMLSNVEHRRLINLSSFRQSTLYQTCLQFTKLNMTNHRPLKCRLDHPNLNYPKIIKLELKSLKSLEKAVTHEK